MPNPVSKFVIEPPEQSIELGTNLSVSNRSFDADTVLWLLNNQALTFMADSTLPLTDTGLYCVRLIVTTAGGCKDTSTQCILVYNELWYMPNAFTPNHDGLNDYIEIFGSRDGMKQLNIMIFDRWGEKVFESDDLYFKWDGTFKGVMQEPDVFVYVLEMTYFDGHMVHNNGSITLIR
jgi:gliding motility-associated-like protein